MTGMKLYGTTFSNNVRRAYAVALHLGIEVELIEVRPRTPAANTTGFRRLSPNGRVPAFSDGDFRTCESHAIMVYLSESTPNTVWPAGRRARAEVVHWMSWALAHWRLGWQPLQFERFVKPRLLGGQTDKRIVEEALPVFHTEARLLNNHLVNRTWLVEEGLTLADFSVAAGLCHAEPAQLPLEAYPEIRRWYASINALPAWQNSAPKFPT
jgi:glutathione S-transferase